MCHRVLCNECEECCERHSARKTCLSSSRKPSRICLRPASANVQIGRNLITYCFSANAFRARPRLRRAPVSISRFRTANESLPPLLSSPTEALAPRLRNYSILVMPCMRRAAHLLAFSQLMAHSTRKLNLIGKYSIQLQPEEFNRWRNLVASTAEIVHALESLFCFQYSLPHSIAIRLIFRRSRRVALF